jgi:hypothetical protein
MPAPPGGGSLKAFAANDVYAASGAGVWHYDGSAWTAVQSFSSLTFPTIAAIDGVASCQLWGGGGQSIIGQSMPLVARQGWLYASTRQRTGCSAATTPAAITAVTPPRLGTVFTAGLSDPAQTLVVSPGAGVSYWIVSAAPLSIGGCGVLLPGAAPSGFGELLIDLAFELLASGPMPWGGGPAVSTHSVLIPNIPQLAGVQVHSQGALLSVGSPPAFVLTPELDIRLGY